MNGKKILLVEGKDDQHVVYAIRDSHRIDKDSFIIQEKQGVDNLFEGLEVNLIEGSSAIERIGIVIDADQDLNARWQKTLNILRKADYQNLPIQPEATGTIIEQDFKPIFGVWIMPDNQLRGMLEDFLEFLVPDKDKNEVWTKAIKCSQEILDEIGEEKRFSKIHLSKAKIHAYLAWQNEPGKPFGTAITAKYLQADNPHCEKFVEWLNRLFVE
jgi:hypothetical protein